MKEKHILYERGPYLVVATSRGGYEIYKNGATHSTRVASIGFPGAEGMGRAKQEIARRMDADDKAQAVDDAHARDVLVAQAVLRIHRGRTRG